MLQGIRHWQWALSAVLFGAILMALILAAVLMDPLSASIP
jgi:hypothetical protein